MKCGYVIFYKWLEIFVFFSVLFSNTEISSHTSFRCSTSQRWNPLLLPCRRCLHAINIHIILSCKIVDSDWLRDIWSNSISPAESWNFQWNFDKKKIYAFIKKKNCNLSSFKMQMKNKYDSDWIGINRISKTSQLRRFTCLFKQRLSKFWVFSYFFDFQFFWYFINIYVA